MSRIVAIGGGEIGRPGYPLARFSHTPPSTRTRRVLFESQGWLSDNEGSFGIQRAPDKQDKAKSPASKQKNRICVELRADLSPDIK